MLGWEKGVKSGISSWVFVVRVSKSPTIMSLGQGLDPGVKECLHHRSGEQVWGVIGWSRSLVYRTRLRRLQLGSNLPVRGQKVRSRASIWAESMHWSGNQRGSRVRGMDLG